MPTSSNRAIEHWVSVNDGAQPVDGANYSVYRWIEIRGLPKHTVGRLWKFRMSEIDGGVKAGGRLEPAPFATLKKR